MSLSPVNKKVSSRRGDNVVCTGYTVGNMVERQCPVGHHY